MPRVDHRNLLTIRQAAEESPALGYHQLRKWIELRDLNGLNRATLKIEGRLYLDRELFGEWLASHLDTIE